MFEIITKNAEHIQDYESKCILMLNMRDRRKAFNLSMSISSVVAIFSFITCVLAGQFIMGIIFLVFFYYSMRELGHVK